MARWHPRRIMRRLTVLFATLALAGCSAAPVKRSASQGMSTASAPAPAPPEAPMEFLLTSAATDFHTHRPPDSVRFRHVRLGHTTTSKGETQYILCGQFQPAQDEGVAKWTNFATIRTSGYE